MPINAYAAMAVGKSLEPFQYEPKKLGPLDIEVAITHCGICHSDLHLIDDDWQMSGYPLVPGHEIVGTITATGSQVKHLELGQRVGIGWQRSSCMKCEWCIRGDENLCPGKVDGLDDPGKQLSRLSHKGLALPVFLAPRRLADEHDVRIRVTAAEHEISPGSGQGAFPAGPAFLVQGP